LIGPIKNKTTIPKTGQNETKRSIPVIASKQTFCAKLSFPKNESRKARAKQGKGRQSERIKISPASGLTPSQGAHNKYVIAKPTMGPNIDSAITFPELCRLMNAIIDFPQNLSHQRSNPRKPRFIQK